MLEELKKHEKVTMERIDELKPEFVWDWEDEFDDIHEAYEEQGRGEAEYQAVSELIDRVAKESDIRLTTTKKLEYLDALADLWSVSYN